MHVEASILRNWVDNQKSKQTNKQNNKVTSYCIWLQENRILFYLSNDMVQNFNFCFWLTIPMLTHLFSLFFLFFSFLLFCLLRSLSIVQRAHHIRIFLVFGICVSFKSAKVHSKTRKKIISFSRMEYKMLHVLGLYSLHFVYYFVHTFSFTSHFVYLLLYLVQIFDILDLLMFV